MAEKDDEEELVEDEEGGIGGEERVRIKKEEKEKEEGELKEVKERKRKRKNGRRRGPTLHGGAGVLGLLGLCVLDGSLAMRRVSSVSKLLLHLLPRCNPKQHIKLLQPTFSS